MSMRNVCYFATAALCLTLTGSALAAKPTLSINGTGIAMPIDAGLAPTALNRCGGATISRGLGVYGDSTWEVCQSFVADVSGSANLAAVGLSKNDSTAAATLNISLYTDDGAGHPGSLLGTSSNISVSGLPTYPAFARAVFSTWSNPPALTAGVSYVWVLRAIPGTGSAFVDGSTLNPCADGKAAQFIGSRPGGWLDDSAGASDMLHGIGAQ